MALGVGGIIGQASLRIPRNGYTEEEDGKRKCDGDGNEKSVQANTAGGFDVIVVLAIYYLF